jgi:uncharacterized phage protein gp47/JayE
MAFEDMTYEFILHRMMKRVTDNTPNLDTREGSVLFNAHAPAALEMGLIYDAIDNAINESFVDTASREYILTHCKQMGMDITVFDASAGVHLGVFNVEVPIGSRWNCDLYNYVVAEPYDGDYTDIILPDDIPDEHFDYRLVCETVGTAPNNTKGEMTPIDDTPVGLEYTKLVACLIQGENETSDEDMRQEYYYHVNDTQIDGNIAQYEKWCRDFEGIGNHKVFPRWYSKETNEEETVKVSILNVDNTVASQELIDKFQEYLDPGSKGMGDGQAPIGAKVTVTTATPKRITVGAMVTFQEGYSDTLTINKTIEDYFKRVSYAKKNNKYITIIPYMTLGAEILKTEGVAFINDLTINDGTSDIQLGDEEIPVLADTFWLVVNTNGN